MLNICSKEVFAHVLPKMDFQDKFYRYKRRIQIKNINDFKVLGKTKTPLKYKFSTFIMVAKVCALYYGYKLFLRVSLPNKNFHKTLNRETTLKKIVFL